MPEAETEATQSEVTTADIEAMFDDDGNMAGEAGGDEDGGASGEGAGSASGEGAGKAGGAGDEDAGDDEGEGEDEETLESVKGKFTALEDQMKQAAPFIETMYKALNPGEGDDNGAASDAEMKKILVWAANARGTTPAELAARLFGDGKKAEDDPLAGLPKPEKPVSQMTDEEYDAYQSARDAAMLKLALAGAEKVAASKTGAMDKALKDQQAQADFKKKVQTELPKVSSEIKKEFAGFQLTPTQLATAMHQYPGLSGVEAVKLKFQKELFAHASGEAGPKNGKTAAEMIQGKKKNGGAEPDWENNPVEAALSMFG